MFPCFLDHPVFYNISCQILWVMAYVILLWDPVDLVPWALILLWYPVDIGSFKFLLY